MDVSVSRPLDEDLSLITADSSAYKESGGACCCSLYFRNITLTLILYKRYHLLLMPTEIIVSIVSIKEW